MPVFYKFDVLEALKVKGYTTYRIRKDKLLSESTVQALRRNDLVSLDNIARICSMLKCQPGDILEYVEADGTPDEKPGTMGDDAKAGGDVYKK